MRGKDKLRAWKKSSQENHQPDKAISLLSKAIRRFAPD
jgi:hypothetical protein